MTEERRIPRLVGFIPSERTSGESTGITVSCPIATFFSRTRPRLLSQAMSLLTEPALGNDIAAMLLLPQHDFEFAHSEEKIENDGLYVQILVP